MHSQLTARRLFDILVALLALLLLIPFYLLTSLTILLCDGRPILFRQPRVGRFGKSFMILKFRTMRIARGSPITVARDERVTRLGAHLRRLKLDELPQMINVLKGDMSLIGPRPEVPEFVDLRDPLWRVVLQAKPGVTDLSSLLYRNEEQILDVAADPSTYYREKLLPAKLRLSLRYQQTRSWMGDLKLLWLTARSSFFPGRFDRDRIAQTFGL